MLLTSKLMDHGEIYLPNSIYKKGNKKIKINVYV